MKKIVALITSLVLCFTLCCTTVFAAAPTSVNFADTFNIYRFLPYGLSASEYSTNLTDNATSTNVYASDDGSFPESYAYSFRTVCKANDGYIPADYVVSGTFNFYVTLPIFEASDLDMASILIYNLSLNNFWNLSTKQKVSDIQFLEKIETYDYGSKWRCTAEFYYHNDTGSPINAANVSFQFYFKLKDNIAVPIEYLFSMFSFTVDNYFYGSASDPYAPSHEDPKNTVGSSVDDYTEKEDQLMDDTQQGRDDMLSFFASFGDLLGEFGIPLLAVGNAIMYFIDTHIVYRLLLLALTLGLFAYVFNLIPSVISRASRSSERGQSSSNKGGGG